MKFSSDNRSGQTRGGYFLRGTRLWLAVSLSLLVLAGCAKYNTFYNAQRAFKEAEFPRQEAIRKNQPLKTPVGQQKAKYELAIHKAQKVLDEYPGHSLTDDALFLQLKAYHRIESYRMSIRKFDLLYTNFPASEYMEEALYLQALNYLLINALDSSQQYLDLLGQQFPGSDYQAETFIVSGDNFFSMKDWERAANSFKAYQETYPDADNRAAIAVKLARCYWWQEDYQAAAEALQEVSHSSPSADLAFKARLLRARVHVRMRDFEVVDLLLSELDAEAEIYDSQGEVVLVRAESLLAQGRGDEASPIIENMPKEWAKPVIKARGAEILGMLYLERGMLEEANEQYKQAVRKPKYLMDEDGAKRLNSTLTTYLNAEKALPNATGERVANLQLTRANALLFGFANPGEAANTYKIAAADTAASDGTRARALFGAMISYRDYLDMPDSASWFQDELVARYPDTPQAFEAANGQDSDLLGFLLAQRSVEQAENYANLTAEELEALAKTLAVAGGSRPGAIPAQQGVRRRKIFLARRSSLVIEPTSAEVTRIRDKAQDAQVRAATEAAETQAFDQQLQEELDRQGAENLTPLPGAAAADSTGLLPGREQSPEDEEAVKDEEEKKAEEEDDDSFDLR